MGQVYVKKEKVKLTDIIFGKILRKIKSSFVDTTSACNFYKISRSEFNIFVKKKEARFTEYKQALTERECVIFENVAGTKALALKYVRGLRDSEYSDSYLDQKTLAIIRQKRTSREAKVQALIESLADQRISFYQFENWLKVVESLHGKLILNQDIDLKATVKEMAANRVTLPTNPRKSKADKAC